MVAGQAVLDSNNKPSETLYDPTGHQLVAAQAGTVTTDSTTGVAYAPMAIGGTISATNPSVGTDGSAIPTSSTLLGASDGTNLQPLQVESASNKNLKVAVFQGTNEATVTAGNALKVDGSAVTQPVSGAITANAGTNLNTSALALESGGHLASLDSHLPAQGQAAMAASLPVVVANNQSNLPVQLVDSGGTNKAAVDSNGNLQVKGGYLEMAGLSAGSLNADLVPSTDISAYSWISLQINSAAFSGTLSFQGSNDNTNFVSITLQAPGGGATFYTTSAGNSIYMGPRYYRYLRVRATAYTSGTATGVLELYTNAAQGIYVGATQLGSPWSVAQSGTWTVQPGNTANTTPWLVNSVATSGGLSDFHLISAATTNATSLKASAGQVYGYDIGNNGASDAYVKFYNKASAPTVGTDTVTRTVYIPKGSRVELGSSNGIAFSTGIAFSITGGMADNDTTAVGAAQVSVAVSYK